MTVLHLGGRGWERQHPSWMCSTREYIYMTAQLSLQRAIDGAAVCWSAVHSHPSRVSGFFFVSLCSFAFGEEGGGSSIMVDVHSSRAQSSTQRNATQRRTDSRQGRPYNRYRSQRECHAEKERKKPTV